VMARREMAWPRVDAQMGAAWLWRAEEGWWRSLDEAPRAAKG
jgi:hypothetical protein